MSSFYRENDNFYLNIIFNGPDTIFSTNPALPSSGLSSIAASYDATKTIALLEKCSDFYCAVIRFVIPLNSVPLYIMPIIPNQGNANLTPFVITIFYNGVAYPQSVLFLSEHADISPPIQNQPVQVITPYYFVNTYSVFINMINISLQLALNASGIQALFPGIKLAWFSYDPAVQLITLYVHDLFTESLTPFPPLTSQPLIYINTPLQSYLSSFNYIYYGSNKPNGMEYEFVLELRIGTTPELPIPDQAYGLYNTTPVVPPLYWKFTEDYITVEQWSSLRKIIVSSSSIPIVNEYIPVANNSNSSVTASFPILTDFTPQIQNSGDAKSIAYYVPPGQYRLIDMISDNPLRKVDIKIYWQDKNSNIFPLEIGTFEQAEVKLGFFRKSLYKNTNTNKQM